ncbi:MAG: ABC transporter ATP-binding protein [Ruminococcaceae bacterium]|nr:ABC transporter ATP-binding protein [Oscillospiraceae bacterium]
MDANRMRRENFTKEEFKKLDKRSNLLRLAGMMKPYWKHMLLCVLLVIIVNVAELIKPLAAATVIDDFITAGKEQHGFYSITGLGLAYFLLIIIGAACQILQSRTISWVSQSILNSMRQNVFHRIQSMSIRALDRYGTGRLITRATNDIETINEFYSSVFLNLFRDIFLLIGIVSVMLALDVWLALISFICIPVILLIVISIRRIIKENFKFIKLVTGMINGFFSENIMGMRIVQVFNAQKQKLAEFRKLNKDYFKGAITQVFLNTILRPSMELINTLIIALLVAYGYGRITGDVNVLEVGILYAFTNYVKQFFNPINDLAEKYTTVQSAFVSTDRIYELMDDPEVEARDGGHSAEKIRGEIEFRDVWFAYNEGEWVLRGVSFKIPAGTKAAFVGATGAGKSTIINLITRCYDIQRGEILVDGVDVREWNLPTLRAGIATVLQDVFLFTGTIRENIDMGARQPDDALNEALTLADAHDFLEPIGGLDAKVTEQGLNFSTGERQLLSFARAIACHPSVLILDEATAHIDTDTERRVQNAIEAASRGRTSIYIAHRLSTIRQSDVIYYLKGGVITESGSHDELMALGGEYASLVEAGE